MAIAKKPRVVKNLIYHNTNCTDTNSCSLKSFGLKVSISESKGTNFQKRPYMTINSHMEGFYKTSDIETMTDYAVVQYIKGCRYRKSRFNNEAFFLNFKSTFREFFGKQQFNLRHEKLVIDSVDTDPVYASYSKWRERHAFYQIKKNEKYSVIYDDSKYYNYFYEKPEIKRPIMHFSDMPSGSSYNELKISEGNNAGKILASAENASMKFITCIYKIVDVPENLHPEDIDQSKAIKCLNWSNSHILNWKTKKFNSSNKLDPNCLKLLKD